MGRFGKYLADKARPYLVQDSLERIDTMHLLDLEKPKYVKRFASRYGAMMSSDFIACETAKIRAIRQLPVHVMRKGDLGPEKQPFHGLARAFHRPNALMSWGDLISWAILRRDVFGTAYIKVYTDPMTGYVRELRPVTAPVGISYDRSSGIVVYSAGQDTYNEAWSCREDGLVVLKTDILEDGGVRGESIARKAAGDIGLSIELNDFYRSLLDNGNHFQGYLETDNQLEPEDIDAVRRSLKGTSGVDAAGQIRIFDRGLKYHDVSAQLADMDLVDQERFVLEKICRACHVDKHHVYADEGAAATTATGADIDFVKQTVLPEVTSIEKAFQPVLDGAASLGGSMSQFYVKMSVEGLLRGDFATRVEAYRTLVYAGIRKRSDICESEEWMVYPGQDRLMQPTAYYTLDDDGNPVLPAEPTAGTSGQSDGLSGIDEKKMADALDPIVESAAERVRKRVERDGPTGKTRAFAHTVMDPVALAAAQMGVYMDLETVIDDLMGAGNAGE